MAEAVCVGAFIVWLVLVVVGAKNYYKKKDLYDAIFGDGGEDGD